MTPVCILVTGSNCGGKSTTVKRVLERFRPDGYGLIVSIQADQEMNQLSAEQQEAKLLELWHHDVPVVIIEGTRINTPLMRVAKANVNGKRKLEVFMASQTPAVMRAHLEARCAKKGKTFRSDYWTEWKLGYEGSRRYPNAFKRNSVPFRSYDIDLDYKVCDQMAADIEHTIREALGWLVN